MEHGGEQENLVTRNVRKDLKMKGHYVSVKMRDDTIITYARKKKIAIWMKNFGLSLIPGGVTALQNTM